MSHESDPSPRSEAPSRAVAEEGPALFRGVAWILGLGLALAVSYNALGLATEPRWGLSWLAEPREELVAFGEDPAPDASDDATDRTNGATPSPSYLPPASDDPLAIPVAVREELPAFPLTDRPVHVQIGVFRRYVETGAALIVDARDAEEYAIGHIRGAINLPADEAVTDPARLERLDSGGRPIIVYCGGGGCPLSENLAWALVDYHTRVGVYEGGTLEWEAEGEELVGGNEGGV